MAQPVTASVAQIIARNTTTLTLGTNVFGDILPETTGVALAVISRMGQVPVNRFGSSNLPAFIRPRVTVLARSTAPSGNTAPDPTNALAAIDHAWEQMEKWAAAVPATSGGYPVVHRCETLHAPFLSDRDGQGRVVYEFSAIVWADPSTSTA